MVYRNTNTVKMTQKEFDDINRLFEIDFEDVDENGDYVQQSLIDELGAYKDDNYAGLYFTFENGKELTIDIDSGSSNYYDNCVLWDIESVGDKKIATENYVFDCGYCIEQEMEFDNGEDTYICKIEIE